MRSMFQLCPNDSSLVPRPPIRLRFSTMKTWFFAMCSRAAVTSPWIPHPLLAPASWTPDRVHNHQILAPLATIMPDNPRPPHDRGSKLWDASEGPSRLLLSSMDRWTSALLADDGIDMPFMGGSDNVNAKIIAKSSGILAGCAAVDHMIQIWAGSLQISWSHGEGRSVGSGDEIATIRAIKKPY